MNVKELLRSVIVFILSREAQIVLKKYTPNIAVVTGSVGKTSSKDALYAALKTHVFVRKSEKNYNGDIGVPLTILGLPNGWGDPWRWSKNIIDGALLTLITTPYPHWLVMELGADRPGDISRALSWVRPTVVVATKFPTIPVHVEFYDSPEAVVEEEMFPLKNIPFGGVAVLNNDDPSQDSIVLGEGVRRMTYGFKKGSDVRGVRYRMTKKAGLPTGISFEMTYKENSLPIIVPNVLGKTHAYAVLAGVAGAVAAGASFEKMEHIGSAYEVPVGRLNLIEGIRGSMLIDDTYNASPVAVEEACEALQNTTHSGRRIAVLGDMLELGQYSAEEHQRVGAGIVGKADILISVGVRARGFVQGAIRAGFPESATKTFESGDMAIEFLNSEIQKGDVVLLKGSQSIRMEHVTKALMKNPNDAKKLIPRQDPEWLAR